MSFDYSDQEGGRFDPPPGTFRPRLHTLTEIEINLCPLTRRGRNEMRRRVLGEWIAWRVLWLAPRFKWVIEKECIQRYDEQPPALRRVRRPWLREEPRG